MATPDHAPPSASQPTIASLADLPRRSSTQVQNQFGGVLDLLGANGAIVIERHDRPAAVLMSVDAFTQLQASSQAGRQLDMLTADFDALVAHMQTTRGAAGLMQAFTATPKRLAAAASPLVRASVRSRDERPLPKSATAKPVKPASSPASPKKRAAQRTKRA